MKGPPQMWGSIFFVGRISMALGREYSIPAIITRRASRLAISQATYTLFNLNTRIPQYLT